LFLAPVGGAKVRVSEQDVRVISLSSPLGQALLELEEGEGAEFDTPRGVVDVSVLTIV
jgi:transcription elongation GreA/GreB family factor